MRRTGVERRAPRRPVAVDLFAGAGGLSLGFEQAGFDVRACVEIDPIHCAVHEFNFPRCATLCRSLADPTFGAADIRAALGGASADVVVGGPPCQGFSMIGKRVLDDPRNGLVARFLRTVVELEARYFVFENVRGLTVGNHRRFLDELIAEFDREGYDVRGPWRVLNAAHYGVPQRRERLFLLGARRGERLPDYPAPTCRPADDARTMLDLPPGPTAKDALGDLPDAEGFPELLRSDSTLAKLRKPSPYAAILRGEAADPGDFSHPREFDPRRMTGSLRAEHTPESRARFAATPPGGVEPISRFFKLAPDGLCNTLRAGTGSDRGAYTSPRPIHYKHPRCITVREAARLHSYPDWFRFHVTKWHGARQIGNSVPPLLGRAVAAEVMRAMETEPVGPDEPIALGDESFLALDMGAAAARYGVPPNAIARRSRPAPEHAAPRPPRREARESRAGRD